MSSMSTTLTTSQDLSASGYTPYKQLNFSFKVAWNLYVRDPISQIVGIANISLGQRWNEIPLNRMPARLYLSSIPVKGMVYDDSVTLTDPKGPAISAVLCMTQGFENATKGLFWQCITPAEWSAKNVNFLQLETPDGEAVELELILQGVLFIDRHIQKGHNVLVHCMAGIGRSALVVICYLRAFHSDKYPDFESAYQFVRNQRSQVCLEESKIKNAQDFIPYLRGWSCQ